MNSLTIEEAKKRLAGDMTEEAFTRFQLLLAQRDQHDDEPYGGSRDDGKGASADGVKGVDRQRA